MTRTSLAFCVLTAVLLVGCEMPFGTDPGDGRGGPGLEPRDEVRVEPGLVATLYAPERVSAGDTFDVSVRMENRTWQTVRLQTPTSCLFEPGVFSEGERIQMEGSSVGCLQAITERTISPGEGRSRTYEMQALLSGREEKTPAPPGEYTIRVEIDWTVEGREVEKTLEAGFRVIAGE